MQIGQFARFAQNYAVRLSDFVRNSPRPTPGPFPPALDHPNCFTVATFIVHNAQALNFARPVVYVSQLLNEAKQVTEVVTKGHESVKLGLVPISVYHS